MRLTPIVLLVLATSGLRPALARSPERRTAEPLPPAVQAYVPFDVRELLRPGWRARLRSELEGLPAFRDDLQLGDHLEGTIVAGTVRLPSHVTLTGDTVIICRVIEFDSASPEIRTNGRRFADFPLDGYRHRDEAFPETHFKEFVVRTDPEPPAMAKGPRVLGDGASGHDGAPGSPGQAGANGGNGPAGGNGSCAAAPNGANGTVGSAGQSGANGTPGQNGTNGGDASSVSVQLSCSDTGNYTVSANGGRGGDGGDGGRGGDGGSGGNGGTGGAGASCLCPPAGPGPGIGGDGGNAGAGAFGGNGGDGGLARNGGNGADASLTYDPAQVVPSLSANGGQGGRGGTGGQGGNAGAPGNAGGGGPGGGSFGGPCGTGSPGQSGLGPVTSPWPGANGANKDNGTNGAAGTTHAYTINCNEPPDVYCAAYCPNYCVGSYCVPTPPGNGSPLLFDLDDNGFHLTGLNEPVTFDLVPGGRPERMGWTAAGQRDAFLVLDRNENGRIDDGTELFGNYTPLPDGGTARNGFEALAAFDRADRGGNGDGQIDALDTVFGRLRLWIDVNHDGISQPGELRTLADEGVVSIGLRYRPSQRRDRYGNQFRFYGVARIRNAQGRERLQVIWDVFFAMS